MYQAGRGRERCRLRNGKSAQAEDKRYKREKNERMNKDMRKSGRQREGGKETVKEGGGADDSDIGY